MAFHHVKRTPSPRNVFRPLQLAHHDPPTPALEPRAASTTETESRATCSEGDTRNVCEKPTGSMALPIALSVAVPLVLAIVLLIFMHRRHVKKQREEEINDKHKSLDFGMDPMPEPQGKKKKKGKGGPPEMSLQDTEKSMRGRGLSMDMLGSPYLLPAHLHGSRESFHSLSRSMHDHEDPYRPVGFLKNDDGASIRSLPKIKADNASIYTGHSDDSSKMNGSLLKNAQRMSHSFPLGGDAQDHYDAPRLNLPEPTHQQSPSNSSPKQSTNGGLAPGTNDLSRDSYFDKNANALRASNNYLGAFIHSRDASRDNHVVEMDASRTSTVSQSPAELPNAEVAKPTPVAIANRSSDHRPPRLQSMQASVHNPNTTSFMSDSSDYGDGFQITPPSPRRQSTEAPMAVIDEHEQPVGLGVAELDYSSKRLSMSVRPLPPDDPADNPEQRANRIRSFYKEYFDDSKPDPRINQQTAYYEDYGQEFLSDGAIFDPATGQFVVAQAPYAEPVMRRAMTPPPRAPPRFRGADPATRGRSSSGSQPSYIPPRGNSSMSNYRGPGPRQPQPRRPMPPPSELKSLPTPHLLKDDNVALFNPLDFAPPTTFRDRQQGRRPDSPMGNIRRPYSPAVSPHIPLASPFEELSPVPSPHLLRNSKTFTALDFAPPPRFRGGDNGSDAGSIRSNRSGMSQVQLHSLRNGAYRVSRIPKEVVTSRDDLRDQLRPTWDLRGVSSKDGFAAEVLNQMPVQGARRRLSATYRPTTPLFPPREQATAASHTPPRPPPVPDPVRHCSRVRKPSPPAPETGVRYPSPEERRAVRSEGLVDGRV
ncbi:hypothetical protein M501DRAFT_1014674 [Patellaria atrata CBS 101060]|uniref:Uncharacterized protein n=1 Tax=Patellaria atrata CBS 101060 TaxID=1346257 RepID=A0A9P4SF40_9PEZI|nr:hypothetical protein M501DRAFT_1014674 [Patellaria atrata CBS 101060]